MSRETATDAGLSAKNMEKNAGYNAKNVLTDFLKGLE